MNPVFWKDKRVLVTGHTGFKGSWACLMLSGFGAKVTGFSLQPPTQPSLYKQADIQSQIENSIIADIRDYNEISTAVQSTSADVILHCAAQSLVHESYVDPVGTYATNVMGTVNLLEAARQNAKQCVIVNVTTDKCYENREWVWPYRENEAMGGHDPYSSSKGCSELVSAAYRNSFLSKSGIKLATARAGNVIGGGDWAANRLVPDILAAHEEGAKLIIRSPHAIRPWQHVLEPVGGYLLLAEKLSADGDKYEGAWNFGPREEDIKTVQWISENLLSHLNSEIEIEIHEHELHEAKILKLDSSMANTRLGWRPRWNVDNALKKTAQWHQAVVEGGDVRQICAGQISSYLEPGS